MPDYLTTRELADLLRLKERKVYDLAASGAVPCSKATGKLLFPRLEIEAWLASSRSGPVATPLPDVFLGSHDPLLDWALRESRCGIATYFDGSGDGLERFAAFEGIAAGLHLHDAGTEDWNIPQVSARCAGMPAVLVSWARRQRGLIVTEGSRVTSITDLKGLRVVPRQPEAGAQRHLLHLLANAGLDDINWTAPVRTEADAVLAVQEGRADAAFGLQALAAQYRLPFVPTTEERFDLLIDRRAWFEPPMQSLLAFCRGKAFRSQAASLAGYDVSDFGNVRFNGA